VVNHVILVFDVLKNRIAATCQYWQPSATMWSPSGLRHPSSTATIIIVIVVMINATVPYQQWSPACIEICNAESALCTAVMPIVNYNVS